MWKSDPIVRLEKAIVPLLPSTLFYYDPDFPNAADAYDKLHGLFEFASFEIREVIKGPLAEAQVVLSAQQSAAVDKFIHELQSVAVDLPRSLSQEKRAKYILYLHDVLSPMIDEVMDIFREAFLTTVIEGHIKADERTLAARKMLQKISKQIFYVSINATVEAKRAGESGVVFNYISQEIRRLAQQAESSIDDI